MLGIWFSFFQWQHFYDFISYFQFALFSCLFQFNWIHKFPIQYLIRHFGGNSFVDASIWNIAKLATVALVANGNSTNETTNHFPFIFSTKHGIIWKKERPRHASICILRVVSFACIWISTMASTVTAYNAKMMWCVQRAYLC